MAWLKIVVDFVALMAYCHGNDRYKNIMNIIENLTAGSLIRVSGIIGKITVETLADFVADKRHRQNCPLAFSVTTVTRSI